MANADYGIGPAVGHYGGVEKHGCTLDQRGSVFNRVAVDLGFSKSFGLMSFTNHGSCAFVALGLSQTHALESPLRGRRSVVGESHDAPLWAWIPTGVRGLLCSASRPLSIYLSTLPLCGLLPGLRLDLPAPRPGTNPTAERPTFAQIGAESHGALSRHPPRPA